jgi:hypothetical protein
MLPKLPDSVTTYLSLEGKGKIAEIEAKVLGIHKKDPEKPYIALKYFQPSHQCFSDWEKNELKLFSSFVEKLRSTDWDTIFKTGGKLGSKSGLGYTLHKNKSKLPKCKSLEQISPEINFFELRVSEVIRVHGFRIKSAFFLVWLDNKHKICPM